MPQFLAGRVPVDCPYRTRRAKYRMINTRMMMIRIVTMDMLSSRGALSVVAAGR
jgi:hypothetical protein